MKEGLKLVLLFDSARKKNPKKKKNPKHFSYTCFLFYLGCTSFSSASNPKQMEWWYCCQTAAAAAAGSSQDCAGLLLAGRRVMGLFRLLFFCIHKTWTATFCLSGMYRQPGIFLMLLWDRNTNSWANQVTIVFPYFYHEHWKCIGAPS